MWFQIDNEDQVRTPSILLYPNRIKANIQKMVEIAGDPSLLWPHVKTHKIPEIVEMHLEIGITRFKCSTIAEAEMVAGKQPTHILIAYPLIKSGIDRFLTLVENFPETRWGMVTDSHNAIEEISSKSTKIDFDVYLDLDIGMHRTGATPGEGAMNLYRMIHGSSNFSCGGLHIYDGHIHQADLNERSVEMEKSYSLALSFINMLEEGGLDVPLIIAGGSPTFPMYAKKGTSLSPGTTVLWDAGYGHEFPDMDFNPAAVLIARIVSKPGVGLLCLDLGHKSVASEMPQPRAVFPQIDNYKIIVHSEEHMVIETAESDNWNVGDCLYGIPWHICPTMALHESALIVENGTIIDEWTVLARRRKITI